MNNKMLKEKIDDILQETNGSIIYIEQMMSILMELGYSTEDSCMVRKFYGKKQMNKVNIFELQLKNQVGTDLAEFIIAKFRNDSAYAYYKCHEEAYKLAHQ